MRVTRFDKFLTRHYETVMCVLMVALGYLVVMATFLVVNVVGGWLWG